MIIHSSNYKHDARIRTSFNELTRLEFGIDFEEWYQRGGWDDNYICHSIMNGDQMISNVSVNKMDLIINGEVQKAVQIGTVVTHPDHRGKGLSRQLMQHVLDTYEQDCDVFYLFANPEAIEFYPKFGFQAVREHQFYLDGPKLPGQGIPLKKLDVNDAGDWDLILQKLASRRPVSGQLSTANNKGIFQFYALYVFSKCIYYSNTDEAIIVYEQEGELLNLYDVVSEKEIDLEDLVARLSDGHTRRVLFHFVPDQLLEKTEAVPFSSEADLLFVKPSLDKVDIAPFCFPAISHA